MNKEERNGYKRLGRNAVWIIGGSVANKLIALIVGAWTARYLGPENYGLIDYAGAYTTLFFPLCTLGINSLIVKEIVEKPDEEGTTLGTTLFLQCAASLLSIVVIGAVVLFLNPGEKTTFVVAMLCNLGLFFQMMDSFKYWFQAKLESKYAAIATTTAYIISSLYKVVLLVNKKTVEWFALASSVDYFVVAVILCVTYKRLNGPLLRVSKERARSLLTDSYHFILSGIMISIYGATDRLMLKNLLEESQVGYYGTAVSICNMWVFLLSAIIDSYKPVIFDLHGEDRKAYLNKNIEMYSIVFYVSVFVSIGIMFFGEIGIRILYGSDYLPAVVPLKICTWYVAFSYLGVARDAWIVCEGKQKHLIYIYAGAALTNVILNYVFIPSLGAAGAALVSLITQVSTVFVFPLLIKDYRENVQLMVRAIMFKKYD